MTVVGATGDLADAVRALRPRLGERLVTPERAEYAAASRVWNAAVTRRPAVVARCADAAEVSAVVQAARDAALPLSVRAGGHDWAGRAVRDGGVVVDLTGMRGVSVDPATRTATVQGGALSSDLVEAAAPHGLAASTGLVGSVGLAGLTTAGGYGPLIGRYGLAADNLLGADVVLADGTLAVAGPDADADLWWALRGGGANFGVLTALRFRLHEVPAVLAGILMFPLAEGRRVLTGYAEIVADAPDELTVLTGFLPGPGGPLAFLCPFWCGADPADGEPHVARLRSLGHPVVDQVAPMPYAAALHMFDAGIVEGNHYLLRSRWLPAVSPPAADALAGAAAGMSSPFSTLVVNRFHGAATRVAPEATAFAQRAPHQAVEVIAAWPGGPPDEHRAWADAVVAALDPVSLPGGYPNLLGPDDDARARESFGANLERLVALKRRYDPGTVFSAIPALV
ncbi:FAD-binding oxidoreductase [Actinoplanes sp. URMC 104]|uniref:FAD-binding oxidoreductase n=1 Tax=Actinoplanes sp. URMC 104 TaxID=3423409 RepID=UPI003F1DB667